MKKIIRKSCAALGAVCAVLFSAIGVAGAGLPEQFDAVKGSAFSLPAYTVRLPRQTGAVSAASLNAGSTYTASLQLFGLFPVKDVTVSVVDSLFVIPCGTPFGIKMYTDGVLVVGLTAVDTAAGSYDPAKAAGIKTGDIIVQINGQPVGDKDALAAAIENSGGRPMTLQLKRDNIVFDAQLTPVKSVTENRYKAGMWVRDSAAGIGTLTFYVPGTNIFAGLGHAICDTDTGETMPLASGEIVPARIYSIKPGVAGTPGELRGGFEMGSLGSLTVNGDTGTYGQLTSLPAVHDAVPVAMKQEVKPGAAQILTTIDGTDPVLYDVRIDQVKYSDASPTRNLVITITDPRLLDKTGGIVQGMSGSPILQNGKLVGAVTHVFVNDPTRGYGIFAENMLKTADSVAQSLDNAA